LDQAFQRFFKGLADFPTFKKKGVSTGFRFPQGFKIDEANSRLFLPKIGYVRYRHSRKILGLAKNITLSTKGGHWFASIQTQQEIESTQHPSTSAIGIDMGIKRFATLSTGQFLDPLNAQKKNLEALKKYQRKMARQKKFGKNWLKSKARLQRIHLTIANARKDFVHKMTTSISNNHALIVIEDLKVKSMSKSASGTLDKPGRNVRQKSGLNRSINLLLFRKGNYHEPHVIGSGIP
jgi:putative transposase